MSLRGVTFVDAVGSLSQQCLELLARLGAALDLAGLAWVSLWQPVDQGV
jgi:hypothetical protein